MIGIYLGSTTQRLVEKRALFFAHNMNVPTLKVFCPKTVFEKLDEMPKNVEVTVLESYQRVELGQYKVTAPPARHMLNSVAFIYIIQGDKTLLYAHDTGYFYEDVFN